MLPFFARFFLVTYLLKALVPVQAKEAFGRLPQLLVHFQEHKKSDPGTSIASFFAEHYGDGFARHKTAHDHSDLPCKSDSHSHNGGACANFQVMVPAEHLPEFDRPFFVKELTRAVFQESNLRPSAHLSCIWQPPKSC